VGVDDDAGITYVKASVGGEAVLGRHACRSQDEIAVDRHAVVEPQADIVDLFNVDPADISGTRLDDQFAQALCSRAA